MFAKMTKLNKYYGKREKKNQLINKIYLKIFSLKVKCFKFLQFLYSLQLSTSIYPNKKMKMKKKNYCTIICVYVCVF